ncbi:MAG TPA: S9 family peptidase [Gaiellaceae bacterium]|nr:S9 family peptidase [Gaiellaceae bacterium]
MLPEDLYDLTWASDPRLSLDGKTVAYVVNSIDREENAYRGAIWLAAVDGSSPPRQLTAGKKSDGSPRWSPDGTRLAFTSNRDGDHKQLYMLALAGGDPVCLTELKQDAAQPVWSPDGTRIAFTSRVPDPAYEEEDEKKRLPRRFTRHRYKLDSVGWTGDRRTHVFVVPADGSAAALQLTDGDFEDEAPAWSPDSTQIAFASARDDDWDVQLRQQIWVVAAGGGEPRRVTPDDDYYDLPSWSPDGSTIACTWSPGGFDRPRHDRIAVVDAATGERRVLTEELDRQCGPFPAMREPIWDGDSLLFAVEDHGNTHIRRVPVSGGDSELVVGGDLWVYGFDAVGGVVVHATSTPTTPQEIFVGDRRLTEVTKAYCEQTSPQPSERFVAVSGDGEEVEAWLVRPHDFEEGKRYPLLLNIHGGPFTQYGNKFFDEFQAYAKAGYAVVYSNPRGSSGYSEEWGRAIRGPVDGGDGWGSLDYQDLMAVVDAALEQFDFIDPERLGVIGGSYGGYMTSWIVSHTDRFQAACSERAVNNMLSEFGSSDFGWFHRAYTGVWPFEDVEPYLAQSPTTYAADIKTPLLILHSENDLRCNIEQAEHLFTILRLLGREVEFVRFPGESHELSRGGSPFHRVTRLEILVDWFGRYLQ